MYRCGICQERWKEPRDTCPLCGSTEVIGPPAKKKQDATRKRTIPEDEAAELQRSLWVDDPEEPPAELFADTSIEPDSVIIPEVEGAVYPRELKLKSKEWEGLILDAMQLEEPHDTMTGNRYGVDCRPMPSQKHPGKIEWMPVESLPDFEGNLADGHQFITEAKVVSARKSLQLTDKGDKLKKRQLAHMFKRDRFGVTCFLLVHYNPRELTKSVTDSETFAFPVSLGHPFWVQFMAGVDGYGSLNPEVAAEFGYRVPWGTKYRARTLRPLILETVEAMRQIKAEGWPITAGVNDLPEKPPQEDPPF
jgi:hypothetical protein